MPELIQITSSSTDSEKIEAVLVLSGHIARPDMGNLEIAYIIISYLEQIEPVRINPDTTALYDLAVAAGVVVSRIQQRNGEADDASLGRANGQLKRFAEALSPPIINRRELNAFVAEARAKAIVQTIAPIAR